MFWCFGLWVVLACGWLRHVYCLWLRGGYFGLLRLTVISCGWLLVVDLVVWVSLLVVCLLCLIVL